MNYKTILVKREGNIGTIKLNRPQQRNALGTQLTNDIIQALHVFDDDPEVHVIVIMSNQVSKTELKDESVGCPEQI